jgi:hypothetical protein
MNPYIPSPDEHTHTHVPCTSGYTVRMDSESDVVILRIHLQRHHDGVAHGAVIMARLSLGVVATGSLG